MGEECDKGDNIEGDGCGRDCKTEHPEVCPGTAIHLAKGMANAVIISGDTTNASDKFVGNPGPIMGNCGMNPNSFFGPDLIYAVIPEESGTLFMDENSVYDNPVIHVRTACAGTLGDELGCSYSWNPGLVNLSIPVTAGLTYFVAADTVNNKMGKFTLTLTLL